MTDETRPEALRATPPVTNRPREESRPRGTFLEDGIELAWLAREDVRR